jgi:hypothetical protein
MSEFGAECLQTVDPRDMRPYTLRLDRCAFADLKEDSSSMTRVSKYTLYIHGQAHILPVVM